MRLEGDFASEFESHIALETERSSPRVTAEAARAAARRKFGSVTC